MYLTIPSKKNVNTLKLIDFVKSRKILEGHDSLSEFRFDISLCQLSDIDGITDKQANCFALFDKKNKIHDFCVDKYTIPLRLLARAEIIKNKGKEIPFSDIDKYLNVTNKAYEYGTNFDQVNKLDELNRIIVTAQNSFKDTGRTRPIFVDVDGNVVYAKVYHDNVSDKDFIILKANNKKLEGAAPEEITQDALDSKKVIVCEEVPLRWIVDGDEAISYDSPLIHFPVSDYSKSKLKELINSSEFQQSIGVEPTMEKEKTNNPFKSKKITLDSQIKKAMSIGIIPFLVGAPGVGKTEIVESQSEHVLRYNMARFTPTSFAGKEYILPGEVETYTDEEGHTHTKTKEALTGRTEPEWLQDVKKALEESEKDGEAVILFLDEFDKLTPSLQVFINGIIDDEPTLGDWKVPKDVKIVLAGNTSVDSLASNKISSEVSSRLMKIDVEPDVDQWIKWAIKTKVDPIVIAYIKQNPSDLLTRELGADNRPDPSLSMNPRKWAKMVSNELKYSRETSTELMLENYMSQNQIQKFMSFIDSYYDNYIEDILNGDAPLYATDELDKNVFAIGILSAITDEEHLKDVLSKISNKEMMVFFMHSWDIYHPNSKRMGREIFDEIELEREDKLNGYSI